MKKILLIITLILLIGMGVYAFYEKYYPKIVAKAVIDEKYAKVLPAKYAKQLTTISDTVNSKLDEIISITSDEGIGFHQIEAAVLEIQRKDVELIYEKLKKTKILSVEQVFDTISNNLKLESLDINKLREPFLYHVEPEHIEKGIKYIEKHDLFNTLNDESAREIVLQILKQKKLKIEKKLKEAK